MLHSVSEKQADRTTVPASKRPAALAMALLFALGVFASGCVVHQGHHGKGHHRGHNKGHGHHKAKIKIIPEAEIRVSPLIVIGH